MMRMTKYKFGMNTFKGSFSPISRSRKDYSETCYLEVISIVTEPEACYSSSVRKNDSLRSPISLGIEDSVSYKNLYVSISRF
jgi:hypothetical protein